MLWRRVKAAGAIHTAKPMIGTKIQNSALASRASQSGKPAPTRPAADPAAASSVPSHTPRPRRLYRNRSTSSACSRTCGSMRA